MGQRRNRRRQWKPPNSWNRSPNPRLQGQVTTAGAAEARSAGTSGGKTRGDTVGLAAALQVEIPSPGASMHTCLLLNHKLFLESSCLVVFTCFTTASIKASFLGVHPSECPKYAAKTCIPPLTLTTLERCSLHSQGWTKQLRCLCRPLLPDCCRLRQRLLPTCACGPHCLHSRR